MHWWLSFYISCLCCRLCCAESEEVLCQARCLVICVTVYIVRAMLNITIVTLCTGYCQRVMLHGGIYKSSGVLCVTSYVFSIVWAPHRRAHLYEYTITGSWLSRFKVKQTAATSIFHHTNDFRSMITEQGNRDLKYVVCNNVSACECATHRGTSICRCKVNGSRWLFSLVTEIGNTDMITHIAR